MSQGVLLPGSFYVSTLLRTAVIFGTLAGAILILIQLSKWSLLAMDRSPDVLIAGIAATFILLGVFLHRILSRNKLQRRSRQGDAARAGTFGISERELEVLQLVEKGLSNKEIGQALYISESTVKTHVSQLLAKLDAKRRSHAVAKARELQII